MYDRNAGTVLRQHMKRMLWKYHGHIEIRNGSRITITVLYRFHGNVNADVIYGHHQAGFFLAASVKNRRFYFFPDIPAGIF